MKEEKNILSRDPTCVVELTILEISKDKKSKDEWQELTHQNQLSDYFHSIFPPPLPPPKTQEEEQKEKVQQLEKEPTILQDPKQEVNYFFFFKGSLKIP